MVHTIPIHHRTTERSFDGKVETKLWFLCDIIIGLVTSDYLITLLIQSKIISLFDYNITKFNKENCFYTLKSYSI